MNAKVSVRGIGHSSRTSAQAASGFLTALELHVLATIVNVLLHN
jgi:hypothetical protein